MPAYKDTGFYQALKHLRTMMPAKLVEMQKKPTTPLSDLKKVQLVIEYLELINDGCKYFDNNQVLTTGSAVQLGIRLARSTRLLDSKAADDAFGTLENHVYTEVVSKMKEHTDYTKERLLANLAKHRPSIFAKITKDLHPLPVDPVQMALCFDDITGFIESDWVPVKKEVDEFFKLLPLAYFAERPAYEVTIHSPEFAEIAKAVFELEVVLPKEIAVLFPFFNPRAIEVNTREPSSVMVSAVQRFLPTGHQVSFTQEDRPFVYRYTRTDAEGTSIADAVYDFQEIFDRMKNKFLPQARTALERASAGAVAAAGPGTFFATARSADSSPVSPSDGVTPTHLPQGGQ